MTTYKQLQDSWIRSEWVDSNVEEFGEDEVVYEVEDFYRLSERLKHVTKLVEILNLKSSPVKLLSDLDNDLSTQEQIMALSFLIPDIINSLKPTLFIRPWLCIIKTLLKNSYQIIVDDYYIKVNNRYVHTRKYTFINKNVLYQKKFLED